jgi:hypothetical protein
MKFGRRTYLFADVSQVKYIHSLRLLVCMRLGVDTDNADKNEGVWGTGEFCFSWTQG